MQLRVYVEFIYLAEPSKNFPDEINADFGFIMSEIWNFLTQVVY